MLPRINPPAAALLLVYVLGLCLLAFCCSPATPRAVCAGAELTADELRQLCPQLPEAKRAQCVRLADRLSR